MRQLGQVLDQQCADIDRRLAELHARRAELSEMRSRLSLATAIPVGQTVTECGQCPLIDEPSAQSATMSACEAATSSQVCHAD
jgi:hypothetical protein